jgi:hypothetical protein
LAPNHKAPAAQSRKLSVQGALRESGEGRQLCGGRASAKLCQRGQNQQCAFSAAFRGDIGSCGIMHGAK